ncbi:MAG: T9SS type A sorting domain-containing protein [Ignavibacteriae bacterium]|nr:T9SS type A sorting domain-containing protein [Ignavibacteriota bacterium]
MKTLKQILLLIFISFSYTFPQWQKLNEGIKGNYPTRLQFVNDNIGFTLLYPSTILRTLDAGNSWEELQINPDLSINQFSFINKNIGWIVCSNNIATKLIIQKTENGGITWETQFEEPYENWYGLNSLQTLDENNIYGTSYNKIISSNDGGETWDEITPQGFIGEYRNIKFLSSNLGFVSFYNNINYEPALLKTEDGGTSWNLQQFKDLSNINEILFISDSTGIFTALDDSSNNVIFKTINSGKSWDQIFKSDSISFNNLRFIDDQTFYGTTWQGRNYEITYLKSFDGGITWNSQNPKFHFYNNENIFPQFSLSDIYFNSIGEGIIIGSLGYYITVFKSLDNGINWYMQKYSCPFTQINFTDSLHGIAFGGYEVDGFHVLDSYGQVFSTTDGGKSWEIISEIPTRIIKADFINENISYVLTKTGDWGNITNIFKTIDRGNNFSDIISFETDFKEHNIFAYDFAMFNENKGWVVGNYSDSLSYGSIIIETNDGCKTWQTVFISPSLNDIYKRLTSISIIDSIVWAVGESGQIIKYTPQFGWKEIKTDIYIPLEKVLFKDELNGWISGGFYNSQEYQYSLFSTTDGGNSWNKMNNFNYKINDIVFTDSENGIFIGNDSEYNGVIFKTSDGGKNLKLVLDNQIGELYDVEIKDKNIWISGNYGLLLKSKDSILTSVDEKKSVPQNLILHQNYPNPFNPITNIEYSIPTNMKSEMSDIVSDFSLSKISLKIYDILGREIKTLVNEIQKPGNYKIQFDGSNLSSGVYYYRIKYDSFLQTRKMLLLK